MAGEKPSPKEGSKKPSEAEERENPGKRGPKTYAAHIPIECDVVNVTLQDSLIYAKGAGNNYRPRMGAEAGGYGGDTFRVTLTPYSPFAVGETPLTVDIVITAVQDGAPASKGNFLFPGYPQTHTFRGGDSAFYFDLQSLRFHSDLAEGDATINIKPQINGTDAGNTAHFTLSPDL